MGCYDAALMHFAREIDAIRRQLYTSDVTLNASATLRDRAAAGRAFAYVWLSAALEQYFRAVLQALTRELSAKRVARSDLRRCLLALANFPDFDALRDVGGLYMWVKRAELANCGESPDLASFSESNLPLDGRTLRPEHFTTVWLVFGLPGPPLPTARHGFAVNDLAEGRNAVAHGRESPITFGRRKVTSDVFRLIDYVEDTAIAIATAVNDYLSRQLYRR